MKTDSQLKTDVTRELAWDIHIDETAIGVAAHSGVVTLNGIVDSWAEKHAAEEAAHRVAGVLDVANEIEIKPIGSATRTDDHVQRELEATTLADDHATVVCDRGTLDGLAYWPGPDDLLASVGTSLGSELERYDAVIHLRTPAATNGYDRTNPLRIETAEEAAAIDAKIAQVWAKHPRRHEVPATTDFFAKAVRALAIIQNELPGCCRKAPLR